MTTSTLRQLPLIEQHRAFGARLAPFAGWDMPVQYTGIIEEHMAVRQRAGIFDVSHMGRLFVVGADAGRLIRRAVTYNVNQLAEGDAHYALMCADDGGIIDDVFVYRLDDVRFLVVNNASNVDAGREHFKRFVEPGMDVELLDRQSTTVMLALQGPDSPAFLTRVIGGDVPNALPKRKCVEQEFGGYKLFVSRTGYTGEDGFELVTSVEAGAHLLTQLAREGVVPCGLGARDTLRLEAALPLYGNDNDMTTNPHECGLGFAVSLDDGAEFSGRDALASAKASGPSRKLTCLKALDKGIMRHGYVALHDGKSVATVTSGGFSPVLGTSIGMAYLPVDLAREGVELEIDVRGKPLRAITVKRPFYRAKDKT